MVTSADAVVMSRPGMRATPGIGRNSSGSTPTGTIAIRSGATPWSRTMSAKLFSDTVTTRSTRWATRVCMFVNEYQRRSVSRLYGVAACSSSRRRSTVIGWWIVASSGKSRWMPSRP